MHTFARPVAVWLLLASFCSAGELRLYPPQVALTGPRSVQQLILTETEDARVTADLTTGARFVSANPAIATVTPEGEVRPAGDGETTVTATSAGRTARVVVRVSGFADKTPPSFRNDVLPILTRAGCNSGACHGALAGKGGFKLSLRGYDGETDHFVITRQSLARRVDRILPEQSLLTLKGARVVPHGGGTRFPRDGWMNAAVQDWIQGGAGGMAENDARITSLDIYPKHAVLSPKQTLRTVVVARYSDGRSVDVTRLAKFVSSEAPAADAGEDGLITVSGNGEAAISGIFGNLVATMTVTVPYSNRVADEVFERSPRHNLIDEHVVRKLRELKLPPSPQSSDAEFVRRVFIDAAGILPTPEEVARFLADRSPDKRAKLIDELLERPEFVDYWTYKWSDVLLVSTRKLPQNAMWAFHRHIRQAVADNKPWDRFARDLLLSSGSSLHQGGGNFFVLHKDVAELSESTAVTFLGMSITCARCHNHPLEKWTQDQYWSMANLFSRVGMKNGDRAGEVLLQASTTGDALHPRRNIAMPPTPLDGEPMSLESTADRRAHFADWLTSPKNPYFAKALVNRVWKNFLGRGLVEAEDDLRETNPPTNRELFDALASDFITNKHDVKRLIRLILNSAAYQRSARPAPGNEADDRFYSHYLIRRMSAEVMLDALSQVTGVPTPFNLVYTGVEGGTAGTNNYPEGVRALQLPDSRVASQFLDAFGRPDRQQTCACERQQDSTVGQALMLNNGRLLNDKLRGENSRVSAHIAQKTPNETVIREIFLRALGREPTAAEAKKLRASMAEYPQTPAGRREAIEDVYWAALTSREFLFNH